MANVGLNLKSQVASGGNAHTLDTVNAYSSGKLFRLLNNTTEKFSVDYNGVLSARNITDLVNVTHAGCDDTGASDCTATLTALTAANKSLYFPAGTFLVQSWVVIEDGIRILCHPKTVLKLPDGAEADAEDRFMLHLAGDNCTFEGKWALINGNYDNLADVADDWFGIKVSGDGCSIYDTQFIQVSRANIGVEGTGGDGATGVGYAPVQGVTVKNIYCEDGLNDGISLQYVRNAVVDNIRGNDIRYVVALEDGCKNAKVSNVHAIECTAPLHAINHTGNSHINMAIEDMDVSRATGVDCVHGFVTSNSGGAAHARWTITDFGGEGWTTTTAQVIQLVAITDLTFVNLRMRDLDASNESWCQINLCDRVHFVNVDYVGSPIENPFEFIHTNHVTFTGGQIIQTPAAEECFRLVATNGTSYSGFTVVGTYISIAGSDDDFQIVEGGGSAFSNILMIGVRGLGSNNLATHSAITRRSCIGLAESATTFGLHDTSASQVAIVRYEPYGQDVRGAQFATDQVAIADNSATTVFTFTVPAQATTGNSVGARINGTFSFHTSKSSNNSMGSTCGISFSVHRIKDRNTVLSAITLSDIVTDTQGADGNHTALDASQFALSITAGASGADQTIALRFTNNLDAGVVTALARLSGRFEGHTAGQTALCPYIA